MNPNYVRHHPKWHRRRMPIFWWLRRLSYARFILRELTSLAVGYTVLLVLALTWSIAAGPERFEQLLALLRRGPLVAFHLFVFGALLFHAITWLNLAPKALVVRVGNRRISPRAVLIGHYAAWAVASAALAWLVLTQ